MYQSDLHKILLNTLENTKWTRSTKDEDNFRQIICSALYGFISPNNVEIPSTASGHGDIRIFGRKIELKYASCEKVITLVQVLEDFDLLLNDEVEFSIVALRLEANPEANHVHCSIKLPMLKVTGGRKPSFGDHTNKKGCYTYKGLSIFLAATFPIYPTPITPRNKKGKNSTSFLCFESTSAISRSSFIEVPKGLIHTDVVGCKEDGLVIFLYKKVTGINITDSPGSTQKDIDIPYTPSPIKIASVRLVDASSAPQKALPQSDLEKSVPSFKIF